MCLYAKPRIKIGPWVQLCLETILPVKKPDGSWCFVQDLRAINCAVQCAPVVPNPTTVLAQVPGNAEYFTVIDLADAFFQYTG